ncbi:hypothetical protein JCM19000A_09580 [Silvimonas sp. JCM 19000]
MHALDPVVRQHLQGQAPQRLALAGAAGYAVVYLFEDSQSCLTVDGLGGGRAALAPGEWLCAPRAQAELQLQGIGNLHVHGIVLALESAPVPRRLFSKCEIPVAIGPGWRVRILAGAACGKSAPCSAAPIAMFDVFLEAGAMLDDPAFAGCTVEVLQGGLAIGARQLASGSVSHLGAEHTALQATQRTHVLVTQGLAEAVA